MWLAPHGILAKEITPCLDGWSAEHDSWEPESAIPDAIISRHRRLYGNMREDLEFDLEGNLYC